MGESASRRREYAMVSDCADPPRGVRSNPSLKRCAKQVEGLHMRRSHRTFRNDPEGFRLPVKLDATSNGEFAPVPLEPVHRLANETAMREATRHARDLGMSRREF